MLPPCMQTRTFVQQMQKAATDLERDLGVRQSARYRDDQILPHHIQRNNNKTSKKPRRTKLELPTGKKGETIIQVVGFLKEITDGFKSSSSRSSELSSPILDPLVST